MHRTTRTLLAFAFALPLLAATIADVNLENSVTVNNQTLVLNGGGIRKKFFIKVYVGGLYLPAKNNSAAAILASDGPRRMVMHFTYSVSKDQMCDAWSEGLEANTPNPTAEVKGAFKTAFENIKATDAVIVGMYQQQSDQVAQNTEIVREICGQPA